MFRLYDVHLGLRERERERGFLFETVMQLIKIHCLQCLNLLAQISFQVLHGVQESLHEGNS